MKRLDNPKDKESIKEVLRQGKLTEFWNIITQALDDTVLHLQNVQDGDDIQELPADQYKLQSELIKAKKAYLARLKNFPETLAEWLEGPDQTEKDFDPFWKPKDFDN